MGRVVEGNQSLWLIAVAPTIWSAHFLLSYVTAAIWCARITGPTGSLGGVRTAIAVYTVLALAGIAVTGWRGYRRQAYGAEADTHRDTAEDRHRFLGFATVLLAGLSAVATLYVAAVAVFFETCR